MNTIKQAKGASTAHFKFAIAQAIVALALFACLASSTPAQSYRGSVRGFVRDQTGAVIVGATVTARHIATGFSRDSTTEADGGYVIPELPAGQYEIKAESKGFAVQRANAVVEVGKDTPLDFTLAVAGTGGGIVVSAAAPLIDTSETQLSMDVQNRLVEELPLNGRDFTKLVALVPGATVDPSGVAGTEKGTGQFNINGNRDRSNNYTLDGTDNNDPFHNNSALNQVGISGAPATLLPLDAIQEFNIQGQFPAEYGRNTGSVVNVITKSGTNELHGTAYGYARNSYFDARNFFNARGIDPNTGLPFQQSLFINNDFGGSIGGPVIHNKTFFFGAYEGQRERVGSDFNLRVPTSADRTAAIALATSTATANGMTINTGPTDALLARFFPPNNTNSETVPFSVKDVNNDDNFILKVDHNFSNRNTLSARYAFGQGNQTFPFGSLGFEGASRLPAFSQISPTRVQLLSVSFVSAIDATHVNEVRFGYTRFRTSFTAADSNFDPSTLGFNFGTGKLGLPEIDFNGLLDNLGATGFSIPRGRISQNFQFLDNYTWIHGTHAFKFGGEYRRVAVNSFNDNLERGLLAFFPCGCFPATVSSVVDILTQYYLGGAPVTPGAFGNVFSEALAGNTQRNTFNNGFSFFAQDDWRLKSNFTINAGLRWEYFGILSGGSGFLSGLDSNNNLVEVGSPTLHQLYNKDFHNFGPRIGFAWNPLRSTVVRASYGIYYDYIPQDIMLDNFTNSAGVSTNPIGPKPVIGLAFNPSAFSSIPLAPAPPPPIFTTSTLPNSIFYVDRNLRTPYVQTWGLNIQKQVGSSVAFEAGYVGTKGTRLTRLLDTNQPDTVTGVRPNPNFRFMDEFATISNSTYHALQLIARFNNWHGFSGFTSYVFSKSLDDASDGIDFNFATAALPQNSNDLKAEKGPSTFDSKHRFTNALNYRVPVWSALPEKLGKGWQLNTIITAMSGRPIPIVDSTDTSSPPDPNFGDFASNFHQRPNVVPGVPIILPHWNIGTGYLNPMAFTQPPTGTFGDLGRDEVYGPGFWNVDFSVSKDTRITERLGLQLRAEFFNIFNHPQWALPSGSFVNPMTPLGLITQTPDVAQGNPGLGGGGPRVLQFAARFQF